MAFVTPYVTDKTVTYKGDVMTSHLSVAIWLIDDFTGNAAIGHFRVIAKETSVKAAKNLSEYYIFINPVSAMFTIDASSGTYIFTNPVYAKYSVEISSGTYSPEEPDLYYPEEICIDTSKIRIFDVTLKFDTNGPKNGATTTKLKDVSKLQKNDVVEFRNLGGDIERRNVTDIDTGTGTISWAEGFKLKHDFDAEGSTIILKNNPVVSVRLKPLPSYPFPNNATLVRGSIIDPNKNPVDDVRVKVESYNIETKSDKKGEFVLYFNKITNNDISIEIKKNNDNPKNIPVTLEEAMTKYLKIEY